ncbi:hypothetical protein ES703_99235 [subsurface metagenome]
MLKTIPAQCIIPDLACFLQLIPGALVCLIGFVNRFHLGLILFRPSAEAGCLAPIGCPCQLKVGLAPFKLVQNRFHLH